MHFVDNDEPVGLQAKISGGVFELGEIDRVLEVEVVGIWSGRTVVVQGEGERRFANLAWT